MTPSRGFLIAYRAWMGAVVGLLAIFPFIAWDYICMLPSFMIVLAAGGPLRGLSQRRMSCRRCGYRYATIDKRRTAVQPADPSTRPPPVIPLSRS